MKQYIDKGILVAEIERRIEGLKDCYADTIEGYAGEILGLKRLLETLDTLEVKEVDINKEISQFIDTNFEKATIGHKLSLRRVAKHFFELGMQVSNKARKGE